MRKELQSHVLALSDHRDIKEPKQRLCSRKTRTELSALSHLPLRWEHVRRALSPCLKQRDSGRCSKTQSPVPGSARNLCRLLFTDAGTHGKLRGGRRAKGKLVTESTVTWRGHKGHGVKRQVFLAISLQRSKCNG